LYNSILINLVVWPFAKAWFEVVLVVAIVEAVVDLLRALAKLISAPSMEV
jgi:hypothetical protein